MNYRSVVSTKRGGPEVLQIKENDLREPGPGEVRVRVLATGVGRTDINYRYGYSPFSPKPPFVPGYEIVGVVDAVADPQPSGFSIGDRVAALTNQGGYSEMIYLKPDDLVRVPESLDCGDVATLALNYVSAYQMLHRVAKVKQGNKVLLIGASGGVGTALLQLGKLAGLRMYAIASPDKHNILKEYGAFTIDYHTQDFVDVIHVVEPGGLDFVFDGVGGDSSDRGYALLKRGGKMIGYAAPTGMSALIQGALKLLVKNLSRNGKTAEFYGISVLYQKDKKLIQDDLATLFDLLAEGKIKPVISEKFSLLEAAKANQLLENGKIVGNIVLLAPELMQVE